MSSSDSASAPTGNRFATITSDDHTGILWIVSILCLIYIVLIFFIRLEARRKNFGIDDIFTVAATICASGQYVLVFVAISYGLGRSYLMTTSSEAEKIGKFTIASQILLLVALGLAKCSVISLCRRLFSTQFKIHRIIADMALALCVLWTIASILAISVDCRPLQVLGYKVDFCNSLVTRWTAIGIIDSITEVAIVGMAFDGLRPLHMNFGRKMQAFATFVLRLLIIVFAAVHVTSLRSATRDVNPGVALTRPVIYLQFELLYSLFSASMPPLNRWLRNFDTSVGLAWVQNSQTGTNSKSRSDSNAMALEMTEQTDVHDNRSSRISVTPRPAPNRRSSGMKSADFLPSDLKGCASAEVSAEVYTPSQHSETRDRHGSASMSSDDMIIRKDVQWRVQYENDDVEQYRSTPSGA